ncbi:MAG: glutamine synthetase [Candidatus Thermoplasmatota archaeon]|nr:glutamine synthetase [Candidatus Thermoplasmatota archaeon]
MTSDRDLSIEKGNTILKKEKITWVQCHFTDLYGKIRSFTVPASDLLNGKLWKDGMTFDGSSIGFARTENSDLRAVPDPETLLVLPYGEGVQRLARVITDTWSSDGFAPFPMDPRNAAKKCMEQLEGLGYRTIHMQPELEFYLLRGSVTADNVASGGGGIYSIPPKKGYFASVPWDDSDPFRNEFTRNLIDAGLDIKFHHHEGGARQVEVEFKHVPGIVGCADHSMLYKLLARLTAREFGYAVSFIPKISGEDSGNGMHVHMWIEGKNGSVFADPDDEMGLSQTARYFIGGVIEHARGTCLFTNPTVNSYKRLLPGFEAPVYAMWGQRNRTAMIRVPGSPGSRRVGDFEIRHSDTSCNPYLAFTVLVGSGIDGIKRKIEPPEPMSTDPNRMTRKEREELGIVQLPSSLGEAIEAAVDDEFIQRTVGRDIFNAYLENRSGEAMEFGSAVTDWELRRYLSL